MMQRIVSPPVCFLVTAYCLFGCNKTQPTPSRETGNVSPASAGSTLPLGLTPPEMKAPTLAPPATAYPVGERGIARDYFMTLISIKECQVEPHFRPQPGHLKLGLLVLIEGRTQQEVPTNPFSSTLKDAQGHDYRADLAGCTPTLRADRVTHGREARGFVTFEIPNDATGLKMKYAPFVVGVGVEELEFALGR